MRSFQDYLKEVSQWNYELRAFLEGANIQKEEEVWMQLNHFSAIMDQIENKELDVPDLLRIQEQVEELHEKMEEYVTNRQQLGNIFMNESFVPAGGHSLPPLPYAYNALEPYIDEEIMRLHHTKHHQAYVDGLNKAEKMLEQARLSKDFSLVKHWSRELAFNGSGHYLHTIFWSNMSPNGGGKPSGSLLKEINKYFGSFEAFKQQFTEAAKQVEGVGWAILVWSPRSRHLEILQAEMHMDLTQWDTIPLLVLDVWEHAYYLQYKNNRQEYINNWWEVVNWKDVEERFQKASQLKWRPY
ncbi:superoxide dismutase [Bacillus sp. 03113]|uniref:superoxide dismutase n=1 Tax=Bacillus sp. 03113 TaxID=2578211 RepID=UPI0011426335|nr:superoxide dismutase [Bacillus sp. 03113]